MALKIRLRQQGRNNRAQYRLVVARSQAARDGRYVEMLGWYDPLIQDSEKQVSIDSERLKHWLDMGAELSEKTESLIARAAPEILKVYRQKQLAARAKIAAKRKARKEKSREG